MDTQDTASAMAAFVESTYGLIGIGVEAMDDDALAAINAALAEGAVITIVAAMAKQPLITVRLNRMGEDGVEIFRLVPNRGGGTAIVGIGTKSMH